MEPTEVHEFTEEVKEGAEKSLTHVSVTIAVLAVLVAMVTVLGHREHTEAVLEQTRAADQWNEYQSRKVRVQQLAVASDLLSLQPSNDGQAVQLKLNAYKKQITKWQGELAESVSKAHEMEREVDVAERKAARFDLGEALLEIAVILASITLLTRRELYVAIAVALALGGVAISALAFAVR